MTFKFIFIVVQVFHLSTADPFVTGEFFAGKSGEWDKTMR